MSVRNKRFCCLLPLCLLLGCGYQSLNVSNQNHCPSSAVIRLNNEFLAPTAAVKLQELVNRNFPQHDENANRALQISVDSVSTQPSSFSRQGYLDSQTSSARFRLDILEGTTLKRSFTHTEHAAPTFTRVSPLSTGAAQDYSLHRVLESGISNLRQAYEVYCRIEAQG